MSEIDPFSDSEWLDIASSRDFSSDNDSLSSDDTDHDEIDSHVHSRRSSMSLGSSRDGEVDAWEGLIEDTEDEAVAAAQLETGMYPIPVPLPSDADRAESLSSIIPAGFIPDIEQPEEDQRVKDALDQSLIGTLSASRSSSGSAPGLNSIHTSIRDLRLSFPDPLSSSRNELTRSYDDVSPDDAGLSTSTDNEPETDVPTAHSSVAELPLPERDSVSIHLTTEVPIHVHKVKEYPKAGLDIVLYGASSAIKWSFVQEIVSKAAKVSGQTVIDTLEYVNGPVQALRLQKSSPSSASVLTDYILVHDRTTDSLSPVNSAFQGSDRPSLAIAFLPCTSLFSLPSHHSAYLPVVIPSVQISDIDPEVDWTLLSSTISRSKMLRLSRHHLYDASKLEEIRPDLAYGVLQAATSDRKKPFGKSVVGQLSSRQGATLFALVTIFMGFAINTAFHPTSPVPTPTVSSTASTAYSWGLFGPDVNHSASISVSTSSEGSTALIPSSLKDLALSVVNPGVTSLSVTSKTPTTFVAVRSAKVEECKECLSLTLTEVPKTSKEVSVHAVPTVKVPEVRTKPSIHVAPTTGKVDVRPEPSSTALSLRVIDSLSEIVDQTFKAAVSVIRQDLQELVDAMDALMNAIQTHAQAAVHKSKGKARVIGERMQTVKERIQYRNDRAHTRALELKRKGKEFISSASERLAGRTSVARKRARKLKQSITGVSNDAWRAYEKTRSEWVMKLKEGRTVNVQDGGGYTTRSSRRRCARGKAFQRRNEREWKTETCGGILDHL
ncbi:hypothetical protein BDQ17DRAFT_1355148 [Cyathus striatus]|nr:hypothetical protein BDQ17DRAFT_1355148 [Cyathus striatus]